MMIKVRIEEDVWSNTSMNAGLWKNPEKNKQIRI